MKIIKLRITPVDNYTLNSVIDNDLVEIKECDFENEFFTIYDITRDKFRHSNLLNLSVDNDLILIGEIKYKVLHILIKNVG